MNTGENMHGIRKITDSALWISMGLLLLHYYYSCYGAFVLWHIATPLSDRILRLIIKTGLFTHWFTPKVLILVFLVIYLSGPGSRKDETLSYGKGWRFIIPGLAAFFGSSILLAWSSNLMFPSTVTALSCLYMSITLVAYLAILTGGGLLSRVIARSIRRKFFDKHQDGFEQEERCLETPFSINLPARYQWKGKTRNSFINFINPRRGILIMGSPGSGKSWFVIEQALHQLIAKGFALFVYDFKYNTLTRFVYKYFLKYRQGYPSSTQFYSINFSDLSRSHRCNLIAPETLSFLSDAIGISRTILLSMNKTWVNRQGEFFVESPINFLAAIIWWLRQYQEGKFCTLPHAIELAQAPYEKLFILLGTRPEIQTLINPFVHAYLNRTMELVDSQVSSAKIPLGRLASPDLYYILTGNDLSLAINDPAAPKILCLGGDPSRQEALAPVISLYIDRLSKLVNQPGKYKCALVCDEFATVRAASLLTTIATARSNNIVPILAVQDLSQLRIQYSRDEADLVLNISGNLICGQVNGETARWITERFPAVKQYRPSISLNSSDTSVSRSEHSENPMSQAILATLSSGEFAGIVADDPELEMSLKAFHAKIVRAQDANMEVSLPVNEVVTEEMVKANFQQVKEDVKELVRKEIERIRSSPGVAWRKI